MHCRTVCLGTLALLIGSFLRAETPASAPAEPGTRPTTQAGASGLAGRDLQIERIAPLASAREGDWVRYRLVEGEERIRLLHKTRLLAELEVQTFLFGKPVGLPAVRTVRQDFDYAVDAAANDAATLRALQDTTDAAHRRWRCRLTVATWTRDDHACERRVWSHPDVPVYGVVRMELRVDGRIAATMRLTDFGRGSPATEAAP